MTTTNSMPPKQATSQSSFQGKVLLEEQAPTAETSQAARPAQLLDEHSFTYLDDHGALIELMPSRPVKRRRYRILTWGIASMALLSLVQYGMFLYEQFITSPIRGGAWLFASSLAIGGGVMLVGREWRQLRQLQQRQDVRSQAEELVANNSIGHGITFCDELAQRSHHNRSEGYLHWQAIVDENHSDREIITLYSQLVLAERDRLAQAQIVKWSGEAALLIALSPLATVDMLLMLWRNLRMIEALANIYGIELGYWSRIGLIRQVIHNVLYAGATELVTDVGMDLLGAELTAKLSARVAQGVGAGLLTARLGLRAIDVCRPLPWCGDEKPKFSHLRSRLINQLTDYFNK